MNRIEQNGCLLVHSKVGRTRDTGVQERQREHVTRETHASVKSRDFFPTITRNEEQGTRRVKCNGDEEFGSSNDRENGEHRKNYKYVYFGEEICRRERDTTKQVSSRSFGRTACMSTKRA